MVIDKQLKKEFELELMRLILVESNDQLYLGDEEYRNELTEHCSQLLSELLTDIQQSGKDHHYRQQVIFPHSFGFREFCLIITL